MTSLATTRVASYARAVRDALSDLSPDQAHAVLDGLDEHLAEIVAEGTATRDLDDVLGPPAVYAAELRASAGLAAPSESSVGERGGWTAPSATPPRAAEHSHATDTDPETAPSPDDQLAPPTPTASREPSPPGATRAAIEQAGARARNVWSHRGVTSARARLVIVFGVLAIIVIRSMRPLNAFEILFGALGVGVLWWLLRLTGRRAQLSEPWASRLPGLLATGAMVTAVLVGGRLADRHVVFIDNTPFLTATTTISRSLTVPDVVGTSVDDARQLLTELGLVPIIKANGTGGIDMIVSNLTPAPGTSVRPGSLVVVYAAPPSSFLPGSTIVTVPTTVTNAQPSRPTTFITVPVIATTTPPSSESTAATSIATTAAPPSTVASSAASTPSSTSTP